MTYEVLALMLLVAWTREACVPQCFVQEVCVSGSCKKYNNGEPSCGSSSECADSTNGGCSGGRCVCNSGKTWSWHYQKCLTPVNSYGCSSRFDCTDQTDETGRCSSNRCLCKSGYAVNPANGKCGITNDHQFSSDCDHVDECEDNVYGYCASHRCYCNANHEWDFNQGICRALNSNSADCEALIQCIEHTNRGLCNGKCTCNTGCVYNPSQKKCIAPNDDTYECDSINQCRDQTTNLARCYNSKCSCCSTCEYDSGSALCLAPNDDSVVAPGITHCMDQNSAMAECVSKCRCKSPCLWRPASKRCTYPNDATHSCTSIADCFEQGSWAACDSTCKCATNNAWDSINKKCVCATGTVSATGYGNCALCPPGTYQDEIGKVACKNCPAGTYNLNSGSTSAIYCVGCGVGTFNPTPGLGTLCPLCYVGSYTNTLGQTVCAKCLEGTYQNEMGKTFCYGCVAGKYQDEQNKTSCKLCPTGTYSTQVNLTNVNDCTSCPPGKHNPTQGATACQDCGVGTFTDVPKKVTCDSCPQGTFQTAQGKHYCDACPVGTFQNETGKTFCFNCIPGSYNPAVNRTSSCVLCEAGRYTPLAGQADCLGCGPGNFTSTTGRTECDPCPIGTAHSQTGLAVCPLCIPGTYQNLTGQVSCVNCTPGRYNPYSGKTAEIDCLFCGFGKYNPYYGDVGCIDCEVGRYASVQGKSECDLCPVGMFQNETGKSYCINCSSGLYQNETGQTSCASCPVGMYNEKEGMSSISDCLNCLIGKYNPIPAQSSCLDCDVGTHANVTGKVSCDPCELGTFMNLTGHVHCFECPAATYQDTVGQTYCKICDENTYNPYMKQSSCIDCPSHSNSTDGSIICDCNKGYYYNSTVGMEYCPVCHPFCTACNGTERNCSECTVHPGIYLLNLTSVDSTCHCQNEDGYYVYLNPGTGLEECRTCHPMCKRCHGPTFFECDECRDTVPLLAPLTGTTCNCIVNYFYDSNQTVPANYCQPCFEFCEKCMTFRDNCSLCVPNDGLELLYMTTCSCTRPKYFVYNNASTLKKECVKCHPLCIDCDGPFNTQCDTCDTTTGGIFQYPRTCTCLPHHYYEPATGQCEVCHQLCGNCYGPTNAQCYGCDTDIGYAVEGSPYLCLFDCEMLGAYFTSPGLCKKCHSDCLKCTGATNHECLLCSHPTKVMYIGTCVDFCPTHYFPMDRVCFECHASCRDCIDGTRFGCTSCNSPLFYYSHQCLIICPERTYLSGSDCVDCMSPCETCLSRSDCIYCRESFYLIPYTTQCVTAQDCPVGSFADDATRTCKVCFFSCLTCSGPTNKDCIICNYAQGFSKSSAEIGECYLLICVDGMYIEINTDQGKAYCLDCHSSCATCDADGPDHCITCRSGFESLNSPVPNRLTCKTCAEQQPGYSEDLQGGCKEACGDGYNMGNVECDDGNSQSGDGCSADCVVEYGFDCHHAFMGRDVCYDVLAPQATLKVLKGNQLVIEFSEWIVFEINSTELAARMQVLLEGIQCNMTWSLADSFRAGETFLKLNISTDVKCSLKGGAEEFVVLLNATEKMRDPAGNALATSMLKARALRFVYISDAEKEAVSSTGSTFTSSSLVTFGLALAVILFQSIAINSFWAFMNMLQMISYLPIIECIIPTNLEVFLTEYLTVRKIVFPFSMLPDVIPNPLSWLADFITQPFSDRYLICGYETLSFLYNFGEELVTWLLLLALYLVLRFLSWIIPKDRLKFIHKWKEDYEYNGVIRVLLECYLNLNFCAFVNIWMLDMENIPNIVSLAGATIAVFLSGTFLIFATRLVETPTEEMALDTFKKQYGTIVEDLNTKTIFGRSFYPLFLFRRIMYSIILVVLIKYPTVQLLLIVFTIVAPMMIYLLLWTPFEGKWQNGLNIYNEGVLISAFFFVLCSNLGKFSPDVNKMAGWVFIGLVCLSLVVTWIALIPDAVREAASWFCEEDAVGEAEKTKELEDKVKYTEQHLGSLDERGDNETVHEITAAHQPEYNVILVEPRCILPSESKPRWMVKRKKKAKKPATKRVVI